MAKPLLPDELWEIIEPLLPPVDPQPQGRPAPRPRPQGPDRHPLRPQDRHPLGGPAPRDGLRLRHDLLAAAARLAGRRHLGPDPQVLLDKLRGADKIDWSRALIDSSFVRAAYGGEATGPSPVDRAKPGSKHHVITDASGIPLAASVTAANVNDITQLAPLFNAIPPVAGQVGHPRKKPDAVAGGPGLRLRAAPPGAAADGRRAGPAREGDRRPERAGRDPLAGGADAGLGSTRTGGSASATSGGTDIHQAFLTLACIKMCASALLAGFC